MLVTLYDGVEALDVTGPVGVLLAGANAYLAATAPGQTGYRIATASPGGSAVVSLSGVTRLTWTWREQRFRTRCSCRFLGTTGVAPRLTRSGFLRLGVVGMHDLGGEPVLPGRSGSTSASRPCSSPFGACAGQPYASAGVVGRVA